MSLFIEEEGGSALPFDVEETARSVVEAALELEECPYEAEVSLLLTTDEEIHKMNLEFRQIDRATDMRRREIFPGSTRSGRNFLILNPAN